MQCTIKLIHINSITLQIVNTMLQIENLEFSYHKKGNPIFNGINLTIQAQLGLRALREERDREIDPSLHDVRIDVSSQRFYPVRRD